MHKVTFQYRLRPTKAQETALEHLLDECRRLHNYLLEQRKRAWEDRAASLTLYDQINSLSDLKRERPSLKDVHSQVLQNCAPHTQAHRGACA
jgi:putative transposase